MKAGQQRAMNDLWLLYGNHGSKHTRDNHLFVQRHAEGRPSEAEFHDPTPECRAAVEKVLSADYTDFSEKKQMRLTQMDEGTP